MRFACLGSGSRGNAVLVESGATSLMMDCGFSLADTRMRLARLGKAAGDLTGVVLTHEHADHVRGIGFLARRFELPVWMTRGTFRAVEKLVGVLPTVRFFNPHETFAIDDLLVTPFPVPHDAREPSQFVFSDGAVRLGVLTDTGSNTTHIETTLDGCDGLILECNHDREMLFAGPYPEPLKARIGGNRGHLDNATAAKILGKVGSTHLQHVVAAHLSEKNNSPALAREALSGVLGCTPEWIQVADQGCGLSWRSLSRSWI